MTTDRAQIVFEAVDRASNTITGIAGKLAAVTGAVAAVYAGVRLARAGFDQLIQTVGKSIELSKIQNDAELRVAAALRNVGKGSQTVIEQTKRQAAEIQRATRYGDEYVLSLQAVLIGLGGLTGGTLDRATRLTLDFASAVGVDAKAAALLFAKAAQGETSVLSRYGLILDQSIPKTEKFAAVLDLVQKKFGGVAEKMSQNFAGRLQQVNNYWGDMHEKLGAIIADNESVNATLTGVANALGTLNDKLGQADASQIIARLTLDTLRWAHALIRTVQAGNALTSIPLFGGISLPTSVTDALEAMRVEVEGIIQRVDEVNRIRREIDELLSAGPPTEFVSLRIKALEQRLTQLGAVSSKIAAGSQEDLNNSLDETGKKAEKATQELESMEQALKRIAVTGAVGEADQLTLRQKALEDAIAAEEKKAAAQQESYANYTAQVYAVRDINDIVQATGAVYDKQTGQWISMADNARAVAAAQTEANLKANQMASIGNAILSTTTQFSDTLVDAMFGAKVEWGKLAKQMIADLAKAVLQAIIIKTLLSSTGFGAFFGFNQGGTVPTKAATGGLMRGGIQGRDSIPALLTPGEVVLNTDMVKKLKSFLDKPEAGSGSFVIQNQFGSVVTRDLVEKFTRKMNELAEHFGLEVVSTRTVG